MIGTATRTLERPAAASVAVVSVFALCIFTSAFLMFLVEPMVAKMVLPSVGGTPAVWTTSVLFFQTVLLAGYGYSHWLAMRMTWRRQALVHGTVLLLPLLVLPIHVITGWNPPTSGSPVLYLVLLLSAMAGLPFFVVATTSPLVQHLFSRTDHPDASDPYFLYRASNLGSALGLLAYPALIEPHVGLRAQAQLWTAGYVTFVVLVVLCLAMVALGRRQPAAEPLPVAATVASRTSAVTWRRRARWILLAAVPSTWMLAVTSYFTTAIRPLPLLWVIPLVLYLLSFAVVFARRPLVPRRWLNRAYPFYALPVLGMVLLGGSGPFFALAVLHFGAFFLAALLCHGELAADRPSATDLTEFYWWVAVGGAAGGLFSAVIAPFVFNDFLEYPIAIIVAALLRPALAAGRGKRVLIADFGLPAALAAGLLVAVGVTEASGAMARLDQITVTSAASASDLVRVLVVFAVPAVISAAFTWRPVRFGLTMAMMLLLSLLPVGSQPVLFQARDFFGVHKVVTNASGDRHELIDGGVIHGVQLTDPSLRDVPTSYYGATSPVGDLFRAEQGVDAAWNVAVLGLGAGSIGCYAQPGQSWTYYEIDPVVVGIARNTSFFTFLHDCTPQARVTLGDGRITMAAVPDRSYDLIVLDAFGGDAPPVHLLTREAVQLYMAKLRPGGVLLFNVSNKYIDLASVLATEASSLSLVSYVRVDRDVTAAEAAHGKTPSSWVVMASQAGNLQDLPNRPGWGQMTATPQFPVWTDDFSDLLVVTRLG
ncbi:MAG: hypothetical protein E6I27_09555 [Chloroflexi bacterium]|nr:MAG: hypothetical protein E6I27_09555 [Chloroflexota bacterium]